MHRQGFSLVELSIVLVILGLLTGGILTGQNLIRAAELRSVTTEYQAYQTAVMTFRDRYMGLPGDLRNATDFWGAVSSCPGAIGTGTQTCNGDGDGQIGTVSNSELENHESARFWQHLANAGLVEGSYTGVMTGAALKTHTLGVDAPRSKLSNAGFSIRHLGLTLPTSTQFFEGDYGNSFHFGSTSGGVLTISPIISAEEMWNIDKKLDDGLPAQGRIVSQKNLMHCITTADPSAAEYNLSNTTAQACSATFRRN